MTGHVERELKHSSVWSPSPSSSGVFGLQYQFFNTESLWPPKLMGDSAYPSGRGFHSPCWSDKVGSSAQPQVLVWLWGMRKLRADQTHRCSFKLHLSQEGKFSFSLFWWIKSLKLIPTQNGLPALAVKEGRVLMEILGYLRQWERENCRPVSDSALQWWKTAQNTSCPRWEPDNQKHQQDTQSSDILSNQNIFSAPCPAWPVHNGQEEAIQCCHFYKTGIVINSSPSS